MEIRMSIEEGGDPDVLRIRIGGGLLLSLYALPLLGIGCLTLVAVLGLVPGWNKPPTAAIAFALIFLSAGVVTIGGRAGLIIDPKRGRIVKWWGILVPWKKTALPLAPFSRVTVKRELRSAGNGGSMTVFAVRLEGTVEPMHIRDLKKYPDARALSQRLAALLRFPLEDSASAE